MDIILDVQGFKKSPNEFVLKELGMITIQPNEESESEFGCFLFAPPCEWNSLTDKYKITNSCLTRNFHGISWNDGDLAYDRIKEVLEVITRNKQYIYVKGREKKNGLRRLLVILEQLSIWRNLNVRL